ncbi:2014_t:CDS:2, partial [Acaulospora morrowiae]
LVKEQGFDYQKLWKEMVPVTWSTIISRQGSATCYQIVAHKNTNLFDRAAIIPQRFVA